MTLLLTELPSLEAEQFNLPGLPDFLRPMSWATNSTPVEEGPEPPAPNPDQLHFGPSQEPLCEQPDEPRQLPLLPDPPEWESEAPVPERRPRKGRLARKRANLGLSPGQLPLF
jgi:hypothetical protein